MRGRIRRHDRRSGTTFWGSQTKRHWDIIGEVVNLAVKIQAQAPPGGTCLGQIAVQNLHTWRRKVCEDVNAPADWSYKDERSDPYRFYRFGASA